MKGCNCDCSRRFNDRMLVETSEFAFKEIANGVYYVLKDRYGVLPDYATSDEVVGYLKSDKKVTLLAINSTHSNYKLPAQYAQCR